jgi:hypothetical protein
MTFLKTDMAHKIYYLTTGCVCHASAIVPYLSPQLNCYDWCSASIHIISRTIHNLFQMKLTERSFTLHKGYLIANPSIPAELFLFL